jgi:hypothetical protein
MEVKASTDAIRDNAAPIQEPTAGKETQPSIPFRQPLAALIKNQLLALTRLLNRINADEAAEGSESPLPLDAYRDSVLQTCNAVDSLFTRFSKAGAHGLRVEREDLSTFRTAEQQMLENCASCLPDLEQLRDEGKMLLASLTGARRESLQRDRAFSDLQAAISKAEESVARHKAELSSAVERVLQYSAMSDAIAEEMSLARQDMKVWEEQIVCSILIQCNF